MTVGVPRAAVEVIEAGDTDTAPGLTVAEPIAAVGSIPVVLITNGTVKLLSVVQSPHVFEPVGSSARARQYQSPAARAVCTVYFV